MSNDTIWSEMKKAYEGNSSLELPERLLVTLEAAEDAGGDIRGKQSAALLVVSSKVYPNPWSGKIMEIRVEDSTQPLPELRRLLRLKRAYEWADKGDDALSSGNLDASRDAFRKAQEFAPDNEEIRYWMGVTLLGSNNSIEGKTILKDIFAKNKNWVMVTKSLIEKGYLPKDSPVLELV